MYKYQPNYNNLDFLRLLLASAVVFLHLAELTQNSVIEHYSAMFEFASARAVPGFFIVSGFLIYMSYERSKNLNRYFWNRVLRIYPAYIILLLCCAIFLIFISSMPASEYFGLIWFKYLINNLIFLNFIQPTLPGVFEGHAIEVINGSLWTLKIEVLFYISVPILYALIRWIGPLKVIIGIYIASILYFEIFNYLYLKDNVHFYYSLSIQIPGQMSYFISGVFAYLYYGAIKEKAVFLLPLAFCVLFFELRFLEPLALTLIIIYFFMMSNFRIDLRKVGDISYGVYIYHFPIIQVLVSLSILQDAPLSLVFLTYSITYLISYCSWVLIEKKSISLRNFNFSDSRLRKYLSMYKPNKSN